MGRDACSDIYCIWSNNKIWAFLIHSRDQGVPPTEQINLMEQRINLISAAWSGCHYDGVGKITKTNILQLVHIQVHLNKLECRGKVNLFSNLTQIVKLMY